MRSRGKFAQSPGLTLCSEAMSRYRCSLPAQQVSTMSCSATTYRPAGGRRRRTDCSLAVFPVTRRPGRNRRRDAGTSDNHRDISARRRVEFVGLDPIAGSAPLSLILAAHTSFSEIGIRDGIVIVHSHSCRDGDHRPPRRCGIPACLALDFAQFRRQWPLRVARRASRSEPNARAIFSPRSTAITPASSSGSPAPR